jgi:methyl-accepting chemotaxis protein
MAVSKVEHVTQLMSEIASATREQAVGVSEIGKAMNLLDQATQQNSAAADETAQLAKALEREATSLNAAVNDLEQRIGGATKPTATRPTRARAQTKSGKVVPLRQPRKAAERASEPTAVEFPVMQKVSGDVLQSTPDANDPGFDE